jgi:hypothetical protein
MRWGGVGVASGALAVVVAEIQSFPLLLLGMVLFGVPVMTVPFMVGLTDARLDTASGATRIGFEAGNPADYEPGSPLSLPNGVQVACLLCGVGVVGLVVMAAAA